jgi:hypothetical protein
VCVCVCLCKDECKIERMRSFNRLVGMFFFNRVYVHSIGKGSLGQLLMNQI